MDYPRRKPLRPTPKTTKEKNKDNLKAKGVDKSGRQFSL